MVARKLPVSVAMVLYNEESLVRRALDSCADIVDDLVMVHDGKCSDEMKKIAKEYGARLFIASHEGAPEPHRPFSFAQTKNEWVLQLDADEYLEQDFRDALAEMIKKDTPGYQVRWIEDLHGELFFNMTKEVLFRKSQVYYVGVPGEFVKPVDPQKKLEFAQVSLVNSATTSNYETWSQFMKKYGKFAKIQAKHYSKPFSHIEVWNYPYHDWEPKTKLKIEHPILIGVFGMWIKYIGELAKAVVGMKTDTSIPATIRLMWYNAAIFWNLYQLKH